MLYSWLVVEPTHLKKYERQIGSSPQGKVKNKKCLKPPTSLDPVSPKKMLYSWLVVEPTHLKKYERQIGNLPQGKVKNKNMFETTN